MQIDFPTLLANILIAVILLSLLWMGLHWAINDARERGGEPIIAVILTFTLFPIGLLVWLMIRPAMPSAFESKLTRSQQILASSGSQKPKSKPTSNS